MNETLLKNLLDAIERVIDDWNDNDLVSRTDPDEDALIGTGALQALQRAAHAVHTALHPGALLGETPDIPPPTPLADEISLLVYAFNGYESKNRIRMLAMRVGELECRCTGEISL